MSTYKQQKDLKQVKDEIVQIIKDYEADTGIMINHISVDWAVFLGTPSIVTCVDIDTRTKGS